MGGPMPQLPPEYLDINTPPDVVVTDRLPAPIGDPALGEPLGALSPEVEHMLPSAPEHRLVTVGDSITHGVISGAVFRTDLSWPALVADGLGIAGFTVPTYDGPLDGLPVNLETLLRKLQEKFGDDVNVIEMARLPLALQRLVDGNEDYWERGEGARPPSTDVRLSTVVISGGAVGESLPYTAALAGAMGAGKTEDSLAGVKPEHDNDIAASSVLAPFGIDATQISAAHRHGRNGGIDTLVVALGANNALGSVVHKRVSWTGPGYDDLTQKAAYNVWRPIHFAAEYSELVKAVREIPARRIVLATVPHVTIAPIAKGVNPQEPGRKWRQGSRFFPYYTDPWIEEKDFRPSRHRHLTHQQARAVDSAIDQFNETITDAVRTARRDGCDWRVLDLCGLLDGLAYRRYAADPAAASANEWVPYQLPAPIADLDARFFLSDRSGRRQGGLFGLDAVHPTTSGYGVIAKAVLDLLADAGVPTTAIDFAVLRRNDTLNAQPPALVSEILHLLGPLLTLLVSRRAPETSAGKPEMP